MITGLKEKKAAELLRKRKNIKLVSHIEFRKLLDDRGCAKVLDRVAGIPVEWLKTPSDSDFKKSVKFDGELDREYTARGRIEQGYLRKALFGEKDEAICSICKRKLPLSLMVAAHIKSRSECNMQERLDTSNIVFGVCLLGCDAFYEIGLITVNSKGKLKIASDIESDDIKKYWQIMTQNLAQRGTRIIQITFCGISITASNTRKVRPTRI